MLVQKWYCPAKTASLPKNWQVANPSHDYNFLNLELKLHECDSREYQKVAHGMSKSWFLREREFQLEDCILESFSLYFRVMMNLLI